MNTVRSLKIEAESWPIAGNFVISRGARTQADVLVVTIFSGDKSGKGECVPYPRYGETIACVTAQIEAVRRDIEAGADRVKLLDLLPAGAARNAVDCALWDLEAKQSNKSVIELAGLGSIDPVDTAYTISLGDPSKMFDDTQKVRERSLLKIKLGGDGDIERMKAVREAAPASRLILDANESWSAENLERHMDTAKAIGGDLVEQPLPADNDAALASIDRLVPVCADESLHTRAELSSLKDRYDCINIKLDKAGGLTEALMLKHAAREHAFMVMIGCMVSTSLSMAPAMLLAQGAEFVDLDGAMLLAKDREPGMKYTGSLIFPPHSTLWG